MTTTADRLMKRSWSSALSLEGFAAYPVGAYPSRTPAMPVGFRLLTARFPKNVIKPYTPNRSALLSTRRMW